MIRKFIYDIATECRRELSRVFRDKGVLIFFFLLTSLYPVVYALIYNTETVHEVPIVVVDDSNSAASRQLLRMLDATAHVRVAYAEPSMEQAKKRIYQHQAYGVLYIDENYAQALGRGQQAQVVLYCDAGVLLRYKALLLGITDVQQELAAQNLNTKLSTMNMKGTVIDSKHVPIGNTAMGLGTALLPCIFILVLQQSMLLGVAMLYGGRYDRRILRTRRKSVITAGPLPSVLGKTMCYVALYLIPAIYVLSVCPLFFQFPHHADVRSVFVFVLPFLIGSALLAQILKAFVTQRESVFLLLVFTSVIFIFLTGISWPRYAMSPWWTAISNTLPSTWAVDGYIRMQTVGASFAQISGNYIALWVLCLCYLPLAYLVERFICRPQLAHLEADPEPVATQHRLNGD